MVWHIYLPNLDERDLFLPDLLIGVTIVDVFLLKFTYSLVWTMLSIQTYLYPICLYPKVIQSILLCLVKYNIDFVHIFF
jgi:hypothetical protein